MSSNQHFIRTITAWIRVGPVLAGGLLLICATSASAQSTAIGHRLVKGNIAECDRRAQAAFVAQGYSIGTRGESYAYARRAPFQAGVECLPAADGNTWAALFVAANGVSGAATGDERSQLLRLIENPGLQRSANNPGNPGGAALKICGWTVSRAVHEKWQQLGGENGPLGCAVSDEKEAESSPSGTAGTTVWFNKPNSFIYHVTVGRHVGQVHAVNALIGEKFSELGGTGSWLGFPISDLISVPEGHRMNFEGGYIVWNRGTGRTAAYRSNP